MKFLPTEDALATIGGREPIQAVANWTIRRNRYRAPTDAEAEALPNPNVRVVCDEGLLFVLSDAAMRVYSLRELGLSKAR